MPQTYKYNPFASETLGHAAHRFLLLVCPLLVLLFQRCAFQERDTFLIRADIRKVVETPLVSINGVPFIQTGVNGSGPFWFVVDTGAETDVVHSRLANRLQLEKIMGIQMNKTVEGELREGIELGVGMPGGARYLPERVVVLSLDDLEKISGHEVDGILGQYFFRCFVVELDYPRQILRLHPSRGFHGNGESVPISFTGFRPIVPATVEMVSLPPASGSFIIDTGSDCEVKLTEAFLNSLGFDKSAVAVEPTISLMLHGKIEGLSTYGVKLQVGDLWVEKPIVKFGGSSGLTSDGLCDGTIGSGFLHRFHVTIDYPHERLWIKEGNRSAEVRTVEIKP